MNPGRFPYTLFLGIVLASPPAVTAAAPASAKWESGLQSGVAAIELDARTAEATKLTLLGTSLSLATGPGGFSVQDFATKHEVSLQNGTVRAAGDATTFSASADGLKLTARFIPEAGMIRVQGEIDNANGKERPVILRYTVPLAAQGATFDDEPTRSRPIAQDAHFVSTAYPVAAVTGADWGVALAIPPTAPCCFGMTATKAGAGVEFYLGLEPLVKKFPNRAKFDFLIARVLPEWGFRSALAKYYQHYSDYYLTPNVKPGQFLWSDRKGEFDYAMPLFSVHGVPGLSVSNNADQQVERDAKFGVDTIDYTLVGVRDIKKLADAPQDEASALAVYDKFKAAYLAEGPDGPLHKMYANPREHNITELIDNSVIEDANLQPHLKIRTTDWNGASISFVTNPNPDLFAGQNKLTVGGTALAALKDWVKLPKMHGIMIDSVGPQWPAWLNYRRDHFPDARYPLTFDEQGKVALHNRISHYAFIEDARAVLHAEHKLLWANAVVRYHSEKGEQFQGHENSRWFIGSLVDGATRESEDVWEMNELAFFRSALGDKPYEATLYTWEDPKIVFSQLNRALAYNVFCMPTMFVNNKVSYLTSKDGYFRDQKFLEWATKNGRMLSAAGWQPVTYARVNQPKVICERYGAGDTIYFTLCNTNPDPVDCEMSIDLASLHLAPGSGEMSYVREIGHNTKLADERKGESRIIRIHLAPDDTQIIQLNRAW